MTATGPVESCKQNHEDAKDCYQHEVKVTSS